MLLFSSQLSGHGAGLAAELGVVLVGAVARAHDQLAVREMRVVPAMREKEREIEDREGERSGREQLFPFPICRPAGQLLLPMAVPQ